ncbi:4-hydroxybenzoate--CoA/benzoate--CoA ligase [Variibacter gotjawalensis]|uniref:4-hydroxybenzoate--CoA/benzoate--CoA ligase n=1 Tax=Variibacter gotjawalensis TaxID=1333996 RepID=A0A0S3PRF4_9BRAD|nr:benzoate-CoA ligase family protein [Variibacter gotjawalensis]NIK48817.1 4-hydroxybenzoate-CoA ligase [Variibacter gotjawalensis]RZS50677.1 benzoate-CoA ligase [Variibacter gotjawalensis]BAT58511.1 4-hydroxybenzoate--CoA/benzoate--CoA ligase [Variibacter gotjawalensis]
MSGDEFSERRPYNAVTDFVDRNVDAGRGKKVAFIDPDRSITYGGLQEATYRFADGLRRLGLRQESRILLLMLDTVDYPVAFWGALRTGITPIPLNTLLTAEQYAYIFADSRAEAIVVSAPLAAMAEGVLAKLGIARPMIVAGLGKDEKLSGSQRHRFEDVVAQGKADAKTAQTLSDEVAFWLYSSGSTGEPKGTRHIHSSLIATAKLFGQNVLGIREDDVVYSAAKIFFAYGLGNAMSFPLSVGATTVLLPDRPTPDAVFAMMKKHNPTIFYGVPTLYSAMLSHAGLTRGAGSDKLRWCVSAGEALPAHVGERWKEITGTDIIDGIGSTEMLHIFVSNAPGDIKYGTSGKPVPGYRARIVDEHGKDAADGEVGELVVSGPSAADGYWNQRSKSRKTFAGEWTHTGDKYVREPSGHYVYCGRTDDMFKVSGIWVSPFEVEAALASHESVLEAAVIGCEDTDKLVKPKAYVVLKNGIAANETLFEALKEHVKARAGAWKYPRWIEIKSELPKTATGKIQRFKLREENETA